MQKKLALITIIILFSITVIHAQQWTQIGSDLKGKSGYNEFGSSVSLNSTGNILAVGAPYNSDIGNNSGQVKVFTLANNEWVQIGSDINGELDFDLLGYSTALNDDGTILAVSSPYSDNTYINAGIVKVYMNNSGSWVQLGQAIEGEKENDYFGHKVCLNSDGTILTASALHGDGNQAGSGYVKVFQYNSGTWELIGQKINGEESADEFGASLNISADGNIIAVGAPRNNDNGLQSGHVRVFKNISDNWVQIGEDIQGREWEETGRSLSLYSDGSVLAVHGLNIFGNDSAKGHLRIYKNIENSWVKIGDLTGNNEEELGKSVCITSDGNKLFAGCYGVNENIEYSGNVKVYEYIQGEWFFQGFIVQNVKNRNLIGSSIDINIDGSIISVGDKAYFEGSHMGQVKVYTNIPYESEKFCGYVIKPNPTSGIFAMELIDDIEITETDVKIYDINGKFLLEHKTVHPYETIDVSHLSNGVYILSIETENCKSSAKLIINKS